VIARESLRYVCGLALCAAAVVAFFAIFGARTGPDDLRAACIGVAVAAGVDVLTYALHVYGMFIAPDRFLTAWGASLAAKFAIFGGVIGWASATAALDARSLAIGCASGFVVFAHHEVFVICRISDRRAGARRSSAVKR
jgi:hypothetical protein